MTRWLKKLWTEEEAQDLSEYALLLFLVALTAVTAMGGLASSVNNIYSNASTQISVATSHASLAGGSLSYAAQGPAVVPAKSKVDKKQKPSN